MLQQQEADRKLPTDAAVDNRTTQLMEILAGDSPPAAGKALAGEQILSLLPADIAAICCGSLPR